MAVTIPAANGNWTDMSSDQHTFGTGSFRNMLKTYSPAEQKTERCTISGNKVYYKGHELRLWQTNLSGVAAKPTTAANRTKIINELWSRGINLVRLHHIDQPVTSNGGVLADSPVSNWYELDATHAGHLANTIKEIRRRGMWYTLDFNSLKGNSSGAAITGDDAAAMHASATSIQRFKQLPPVNEAASDQLKAYTANLMALDVSVFSGESGVTIGTDPHNLYNTITNEHFPSFAVAGDTALVMNVWSNGVVGANYDYTNSTHRAAYATACIDWMNNDFKPWLNTNGWGEMFLAWGSEFGTDLTEYDALRREVDIKCLHAYCPVVGGTGVSLQPGTPQSLLNSMTDIFASSESVIANNKFSGPYIIEEYNSSDPNRFKAEAIPYGAIFSSLNEWAGFGPFDWADGSWDGGATPTIAIRQYQVSHDRVRDASMHLAGAIYLRRDLNPTAQATATNYASENRGAATWKVDTERTIAHAGPATSSSTFQRGQSLTVATAADSNWDRAVLFVTSTDSRPIWESKNLLVGHLTDMQARSREFSDTFTTMNVAGSGNCVAHGTATITFYSFWPNNLTIYKLTHAGARGGTVTPSINGNLVTFTATVDASNAVMLYEVFVSGVKAGG